MANKKSGSALTAIEQINTKGAENAKHVWASRLPKGAEVIQENGQTVVVLDIAKTEVAIGKENDSELFSFKAGGCVFGVDIPSWWNIRGKNIGVDRVRFIGQTFEDIDYFNIDADIDLDFVDCELTSEGFSIPSIKGEHVTFLNSDINIYNLLAEKELTIKDSKINATYGIQALETTIINSEVAYVGDGYRAPFSDSLWRKRCGLAFGIHGADVTIENSRIDAGVVELGIYAKNLKMDDETEIIAKRAKLQGKSINFNANNANNTIQTFFEQDYLL